VCAYNVHQAAVAKHVATNIDAAGIVASAPLLAVSFTLLGKGLSTAATVSLRPDKEAGGATGATASLLPDRGDEMGVNVGLTVVATASLLPDGADMAGANVSLLAFLAGAAAD
jgi:hypothetical protein